MSTAPEALVESLLWEGYALYPYTPGATKNATPTPFGIVYPPAYADGRSTFAELVVDCLAEAPAGTAIEAEVHFLQPDGPRHEARPRTLALPGAELGGDPVTIEELFGAGADRGLPIRATLSSVPAGDGPARTPDPPPGTARFHVTLRIENRGAAPAGMGRAEALTRSAISAHPLLRLAAGRFVSPLDSGPECRSVNTWPVLASDADDVLLGAAIVLPDHPALAPESLGGLFDSTEIEEALLLHVQALSDAERAEIAAGDPAVAAMIQRAAATTPEELLTLHGRVEVRDRETTTPPVPSADVRDPTRGEAEVTVDGRTFRRGGRVVLRPSPEADLQARMLDGRTATIERIFVDYDGKVHLGVIAEGLPGQDLLRETSRFLFFFPPEVEVV
jgi:hypothetical protein